MATGDAEPQRQANERRRAGISRPAITAAISTNTIPTAPARDIGEWGRRTSRTAGSRAASTWPAGKNAMYFDVVDRFFGGKPFNGSLPGSRPGGLFRLRQRFLGAAIRRNRATPRRRRSTVQNQDTGRWKIATISLSDAFMGNRCAAFHGSHAGAIHLSENTLFHMVELGAPP